MKNNNITKWAALLLTVSGMAALPLNTMAAFSDNPGVAGTNVQANGATPPASGTASSTTYNTTNNNAYGFYALNSGTVWGKDNTTITTSGTNAYALNIAAGSAIITGNNTTINVGPAGRAVNNSEGSVTLGNNNTINLNGVSSPGTGVGLNGSFASATIGNNLTINQTVSGISGGYGLELRRGTATVGDGLTINAAADAFRGIMVRNVLLGGNDAMLSLGSGAEITLTGSAAFGVAVAEGGLILPVANAKITVPNGIGVAVGGTLALVNSEITAGTVARIDQWDGMSTELIISGGTHTAVSGPIVEINRSSPNGSNHIEINDATVNGSGTLLVNNGTSGLVELEINNSDLNNAGGIVVSATNSGTTDVTVSGGSGVTGDVTNSGSGSLIINLDDSSLTGNITGTNSGTTIINGGNGSTITGDVTGSGSSTIDITVSGPGSSITGDINQQDDSKITIEINDGANGSGAWNGGNIIVGPGSQWDFTDDSHLNNGWNDGTLNIGDKTVIFDNLTNNGKILIDVNTDTGGHGTLDVTGSTGGDGKINVNVTGSTALTDDEKNKIINDLLDNNAKDAWQFDPIEWGLEELTPTPGPDGNFYLRDDGKLSTAGSIAVGLIAAQKGAWFAQQNSLLKRMGELRLAADTQQQLIGKDDKSVTLSADKLIENVWIRAYGQQLNYGASVTGQAFKQYVYGTDIGTDHKFTLDNNNALYAGVFAGYGAADTDHRHYGSKSDISNYYFGLYASWLNDSGWYLDATIKAQYSDNSLDGYANGVDHFNGSYNNWGVGGSLELGKQFKFQDDWFIEPQLQANYLHLLAEDYTMSQGLNINTSDLDAFQFRVGIVAGRTLKLKNGGALQPYVKLSGVEMVSTGGKLSAMGNTVRPNLDGARAELGAGVIWQLDAHNQLHLDYEASFGDKYDKPWGLTAGYRYQF